MNFGSFLERPIQEQMETLKSGGYLLGHYVEALDSYRYCKPRRAACLALRVSRFIEDLGLRCRALGVAASSYRILGRTDLAWKQIRRALKIAVDFRLRAESAEILQRAAYLVAEEGRHKEALSMLRLALVAYFDQQNYVGIGRILVSEGLMLNRLGRSDQAIIAYRSALLYLPVTDRRYRAAAYLERGLLFFEKGRLKEAQRDLSLAERIIDPLETTNLARISWRKADIASALGLNKEAVKYYFEAKKLLISSPRDCALVSVDLARGLVSIGHLAGAREELEEATEFFLSEPISNSKVKSALVEIIKIGYSASLNSLTLKSVKRALGKPADGSSQPLQKHQPPG